MIPVIFGLMLVHTKSLILKIVYGIIWFFFLPNTIYLLTDIGHFFKDWSLVPVIYQGLFILEYSFLMITGILSFIFALYPVEKFIRRASNKKKKKEYLIYAINFVIGFGLVLGRIQRVNSWDIITNTSFVIYQSIHTITSVYLVLLVLFFGLSSNLIYFSFRDFLQKKWKYLFT